MTPVPRERAAIHSLYRYPIKGLTPEPLRHADLSVGETVPGDRLYAIENGASGFDPAAPSYLPKIRFLMLMRHSRLARLEARYDPVTRLLSIREGGREVVRGVLATSDGRAAIERFFADYCADELRGPPKVLHAAGHSFSDVAAKVVSIINLGSVAAIENAVGAPVHSLRFRGNVYVAGWPAWHEFDLVGRELAVGPSARLRIVRRIERCAATEVDPETGIRDLPIPRELMRHFGHTHCGVYSEVVAGGRIAPGDAVTELPAAATPALPF